MSIEVIGIDDVQNSLSILQRRIGNMQPIMSEIGNMLTNEIDETFDDQGRPKWVQLSRTTLRLGYTGMGKNGAHTHKQDGRVTRGFERYMSDKKILYTHGRLRDSFVREGSEGNIHEVTDSSITVGSNLAYAAIQHFGGMAGRGRKVKIPSRKILPIDNNGILKESMRVQILNYLERRLGEDV